MVDRTERLLDSDNRCCISEGSTVGNGSRLCENSKPSGFRVSLYPSRTASKPVRGDLASRVCRPVRSARVFTQPRSITARPQNCGRRFQRRFACRASSDKTQILLYHQAVQLLCNQTAGLVPRDTNAHCERVFLRATNLLQHRTGALLDRHCACHSIP